MDVTKSYFVHIQTLNSEGPALTGLGKPPEPISKAPQIYSTPYNQSTVDPLNNKTVRSSDSMSFRNMNNDNRIPAMSAFKK